MPKTNLRCSVANYEEFEMNKIEAFLLIFTSLKSNTILVLVIWIDYHVNFKVELATLIPPSMGSSHRWTGPLKSILFFPSPSDEVLCVAYGIFTF